MANGYVFIIKIKTTTTTRTTKMNENNIFLSNENLLF